jgi:hypothetical protein
MGELVIVFCYVRSSGKVIFNVANESWKFNEIWKLDRKTVSIPISRFESSTNRSLTRIEWLSRMRGLTFLLSRHFIDRQIMAEIKGTEDAGKDEVSPLDETEIGLLYQIFEYIGFCEIKLGYYALITEGPLKSTLGLIARRIGVRPRQACMNYR